MNWKMGYIDLDTNS